MPAANAARMMNGRIESAGGTPRAAWSNRIWMYQRSGSSDAPGLREIAHRQHREADAGKTEGRRADDAGQAEAEGEVADEQLKQRAERTDRPTTSRQAAAPISSESPRNGTS